MPTINVDEPASDVDNDDDAQSDVHTGLHRFTFIYRLKKLILEVLYRAKYSVHAF